MLLLHPKGTISMPCQKTYTGENFEKKVLAFILLPHRPPISSRLVFMTVFTFD